MGPKAKTIKTKACHHEEHEEHEVYWTLFNTLTVDRILFFFTILIYLRELSDLRGRILFA